MILETLLVATALTCSAVLLSRRVRDRHSWRATTAARTLVGRRRVLIVGSFGSLAMLLVAGAIVAIPAG